MSLEKESLERKTSTQDRNSVVESGAETVEFTRDEELKLLRKFDFFILPPLALMYLCNALDKGIDIHLKGNQYYLLVMIFYVSRFSAARVLPIMMIGFAKIFAIRFFLGIFESPMLPAVVYYLSTFYKRNELASRVGVFYAAASIAGAFSGLIAYGAGTVFFAILAWFWLPRAPATWSFLTPRQKEIARSRILADSSVEIDEKVNIADAFAPFKSGLYWIWILIRVPLASVNNFLPQIIAGFHYSTVKTNLYTVAPNILGTVALLLLTFSSDYFRERSIRECIPLATGITGFLILRFIDVLEHLHVAYFACFLITMGAFAPSVLVSYSFPRSAAGLISTNVFRAQDEPRYIPALATSAAFGGFCFILVAGTGIWMRYENAKRNRAQGVNLSAQDVDTSTLRDGPSNPSFRYMY
ncbi:major facilitator superfamily domain-containing protein [Mycena olivaceomarginata]|nr:major facilitator superfamily domain-containing protein [Mycena olivaceomarginata]